MSTLLERLNASRRFARSVYAPHKLALRQGVPSPLRAVGVTAPLALAPVAARAVFVAPARAVTRDAALVSPALRPNPATLEPQIATDL